MIIKPKKNFMINKWWWLSAEILKLKKIQTDLPINIILRGAPSNILWGRNLAAQKNLLKKHFDAIFALVCAEKGLISSGSFHHRAHPSTGSEANTTRWHLMVWEENCAICPKVMLMMQTITKLTWGHYKEDNLKNGKVENPILEMGAAGRCFLWLTLQILPKLLEFSIKLLPYSKFIKIFCCINIPHFLSQIFRGNVLGAK